MKLPPDISDAIAVAAKAWAESTSDLPLIVKKTPEGAVFLQSLPKARYTKTDFAKALEMSRGTFRKVEERFGLQPASDGQYDAATVEWVRRQLVLEESRKSPYELRQLARSA